MSSRTLKAIIICEGTQDAVFLRRFLERSSGLGGYNVRVRKCPPGHQDAKQWIRNELPGQLEAFRNYNAKNRATGRVLFVMADADNRTVRQRIADVSSGCNPKPMPNENVCFIIPRWAVETWIKYLRNETFDENTKIQPGDRYDNARDCGPQVDELKAMCDSGTLRQPSPASLDEACKQFQRVSSVFRQ